MSFGGVAGMALRGVVLRLLTWGGDESRCWMDDGGISGGGDFVGRLLVRFVFLWEAFVRC